LQTTQRLLPLLTSRVHCINIIYIYPFASPHQSAAQTTLLSIMIYKMSDKDSFNSISSPQDDDSDEIVFFGEDDGEEHCEYDDYDFDYD
jgi:hypothetical protein